ANWTSRQDLADRISPREVPVGETAVHECLVGLIGICRHAAGLASDDRDAERSKVFGGDDPPAGELQWAVQRSRARNLKLAGPRGVDAGQPARHRRGHDTWKA